MYLYLSLVERKVAGFYYNMDGRRDCIGWEALFGLVILTYFHQYLTTFDGVLVTYLDSVRQSDLCDTE